MNLSCIIIEDEPLAIDKLTGFINRLLSLNLISTYDNAIEGLQFIQNNKVDLVFLDIQMEELTGIQMLEAITHKPYIIITSAYAEYALKGYELNVFDYLLKPFGFERFLQSVTKVQEDFAKKMNPKALSNNHIFVKSEYRQENICVDDILYIEGMREYLRIVLPEKKIMTKLSFRDLLRQLPEHLFIQVHKSWVINTQKINAIERNRILIGEISIPIGRAFQNELKTKLKIR